MRSKLGLLVMIIAVTLFAAGCGTDDQMIAEKTADYPGVYKAKCLSCHGVDLEGRMGSRTDLREVGDRLSREEIVDVLHNGRGAMPGFQERIPEEDIQELADWLVTYKAK